MTQFHLILFRYLAMTSCWKQYVLIRRTCSGPFSRAPMWKGALKHVAKCIALAVWSLSSVHSMHHVFIEWVFLSALWMFLISSACYAINHAQSGWWLFNKLCLDLLFVKWEWWLQSTNIASSSSWHAPYLSASGMVLTLYTMIEFISHNLLSSL